MREGHGAERATPRRVGALLLAVASGSCAHLGFHTAPSLGGREVSLRFEGTCAHLACCSAYAVAVAPDTPGAYRCQGPSSLLSCSRNVGWFAPGFTCDPHSVGRYRQPSDPPYLACHDQERWLSLPGLDHQRCGERFLVCRNGVRVSAVARDRSAENRSGNEHYEGSLGLLLALGADPEQRDTTVSIYAMHERDRIAADPHCVGPGGAP